MGLVIILIIVSSILAIFSVAVLFNFNRMSYRSYESARRKARGLFQQDQLEKAQAKISTALRNIGWDYSGILQAKISKRMIGIENSRNFWHRMASSMGIIPANTIEWAVPGLLLLGEIFEKSGKYELAYKLYDDLAGFMESALEAMPRIDRTRAEIELHQRQASIDLREGHCASALRHHLTHVLNFIYVAKLENNEVEFRSRFPYKGDKTLVEILGSIDKDIQHQDFIDIVNKNVNVEMGRVHIDRAERELNSLLSGRKTLDAKSREATRVILQSVLQKAIGGEEKDADKKDKDKKKDKGKDEDDVILL